jgi:hypothetical protein
MLYQKYQTIKPLYTQLGVKIPDFITDNLKHNLRGYQQNALNNFFIGTK